MIQEQINNCCIDKKGNMDINYMQLKESVEKVCCKKYINEEDFYNAVSEMLDTLNKLIECVSYHNLIRLFEVSIIYFHQQFWDRFYVREMIYCKNLLDQIHLIIICNSICFQKKLTLYPELTNSQQFKKKS